MKHKTLLASLLATAFTLVGCASVSSEHTSVDKRFEFTDTQRIVPGMQESEVVKLLGRPNAFGLDDKCQRYLVYEITKVASTAGSVSAMVAQGSASSSSSRGFELRIQLRNHVVDRVAYKIYAAS